MFIISRQHRERSDRSRVDTGPESSSTMTSPGLPPNAVGSVDVDRSSIADDSSVETISSHASSRPVGGGPAYIRCVPKRETRRTQYPLYHIASHNGQNCLHQMVCARRGRQCYASRVSFLRSPSITSQRSTGKPWNYTDRRPSEFVCTNRPPPRRCSPGHVLIMASRFSTC